jgi:hypothetical protein
MKTAKKKTNIKKEAKQVKKDDMGKEGRKHVAGDLHGGSPLEDKARYRHFVVT